MKFIIYIIEKNFIFKENLRLFLKKICCIFKGKKIDSILFIYICISSIEIFYMYIFFLFVNLLFCIIKGYKIF